MKERKILENLMMRREDIEALFDVFYRCNSYYYLYTSTQDYIVFEMENGKEIKVKITGIDN